MATNQSPVMLTTVNRLVRYCDIPQASPWVPRVDTLDNTNT